MFPSTACAAGNLHECVYMAEETGRKYFTQFYIYVMEIYGGRFFNRFPTKTEMETIEKMYTENSSLVA